MCLIGLFGGTNIERRLSAAISRMNLWLVEIRFQACHGTIGDLWASAFVCRRLQDEQSLKMECMYGTRITVQNLSSQTLSLTVDGTMCLLDQRSSILNCQENVNQHAFEVLSAMLWFKPMKFYKLYFGNIWRKIRLGDCQRMCERTSLGAKSNDLITLRRRKRSLKWALNSGLSLAFICIAYG